MRELDGWQDVNSEQPNQRFPHFCKLRSLEGHSTARCALGRRAQRARVVAVSFNMALEALGPLGVVLAPTLFICLSVLSLGTFKVRWAGVPRLLGTALHSHLR